MDIRAVVLETEGYGGSLFPSPCLWDIMPPSLFDNRRRSSSEVPAFRHIGMRLICAPVSCAELRGSLCARVPTLASCWCHIATPTTAHLSWPAPRRPDPAGTQ